MGDNSDGTADGGNTDPAADLPNYLSEGLERQDVETLRSAKRYIDTLIGRRERPVEPEELPDSTDAVSEAGDGYIVSEYVKCGKDNCKCASGAEADMHGPYDYRYYRDDSGVLQKEYADSE